MPPPGPRSYRAAWWLGVVLLSVALVLDLIAGDRVKLVTTTSLLAMCLLAALSPIPRPRAVMVWLGALACVAIGGMVWRMAAGPG